MVIIGGLGSILGSFLGAAFILVLPIALDQVPMRSACQSSVETVSLLVFIITGALICWLLIVEPRGFASLVDRKGKAEALAIPVLRSTA